MGLGLRSGLKFGCWLGLGLNLTRLKTENRHTDRHTDFVMYRVATQIKMMVKTRSEEIFLGAEAPLGLARLVTVTEKLQLDIMRYFKSNFEAVLKHVRKYTSMQVYKYVSIQVCKYTSMKVYSYASMQVYKHTSLKVCKYARNQV